MGFVYLITNVINGKLYVGRTTCPSLKRYLAGNISAALRGKRDKPILYNAMRKYAASAFVIESLAEAALLDTLNELEKLWIALLGTRDKTVGYNIVAGGEGDIGPRMLGKKRSVEWRAAKSETMRRTRAKQFWSTRKKVA